MDDLIALGRTLRDQAEPGFFETETHRILKERFTELAFSVQEFDGIPGFMASADGKRENKSVALLADMDGLPTGGGGYQHSCGHLLHMTALYGTARNLRDCAAGVLSRTAFITAPAEEYVDFDRRQTLLRQGRIGHYSGKQEFTVVALPWPAFKSARTWISRSGVYPLRGTHRRDRGSVSD